MEMIDMCKAIQEMYDDGVKDGIQKGVERGIAAVKNVSEFKCFRGGYS